MKFLTLLHMNEGRFVLRIKNENNLILLINDKK